MPFSPKIQMGDEIFSQKLYPKQLQSRDQLLVEISSAYVIFPTHGNKNNKQVQTRQGSNPVKADNEFIPGVSLLEVLQERQIPSQKGAIGTTQIKTNLVTIRKEMADYYLRQIKT